MILHKIRLATVACCLSILTPTAQVAVAQEAAAETSILTAPLPPVDGPHRTVAVASFGGTSRFQVAYGLSNVGGGLAAMLTSALVESGQFVVVERTQLSSVLAEQEIGASGIAATESAVVPGRLLGAQLLIVGEVTEFSQSDKGKGLGIGLGSGAYRLGLSPQKQTGKIGLDVRVIDTASGRVISSFTVRQELKSRAMAVSLGYKNQDAGISSFMQEPIGEAARVAINEVVQRFAAAAATQPWQGSVVEVQDDTLVINAGGDAGIRVGDRFEIRKVAKVLTDPSSGRILGRNTVTTGQAVVEQVGDTVAVARYTSSAESIPARGDLLVSGT